jgi:hypothetical protein
VFRLLLSPSDLANGHRHQRRICSESQADLRHNSPEFWGINKTYRGMHFDNDIKSKLKDTLLNSTNPFSRLLLLVRREAFKRYVNVFLGWKG